MKTVRATDLRDEFAENLGAVTFAGERVTITKHGKPVAALISADDLEMFEALEDAADLRLVAEAKAESDERIPYDQVRKELGLE